MRASATVRLFVWLLLDVLVLAASWGCVDQEDVVLRYKGARFNERISRDLQGLTPTEATTDLCYGLFSDGSGDPDGDGPRTGKLVSEIFPVTASDLLGPGNLVQAPTLFVGRSGSNGDEIRLSWEVVTELDPEPGSKLEEMITPGYAEVGLCTLSSPVSRLLFEDPDPNAPRPNMDAPPTCLSSGDQTFAVTLPKDPALAKNVPNSCRFLVPDTVRVEAFHPTVPNPDGLPPALDATGGFRCGSEQYDGGTPVAVPLSGCMINAVGRFPACGFPCGFSPTQDATYRVRVDSMNQEGLPVTERWLRPNVLVVNGSRTIVRPMVKPDPMMPQFSWQTEVLQPGGAEGPFRWAENFSPTVRVETVQIISRDRTGGTERVETPDQRRLTAIVPIAGTAARTLACTGTDTPAGVVFDMVACANSPDLPGGYTLTPTYHTPNLRTDPIVTQPITWRASVPSLAADRQVFIRFGLRAQTMGAALRVSPALNFGRVPDTEYRQGTVEIENIGGETITINELGLVAGLWQPQDFSVFAVGDPVPVPLPIESKTTGDGTTLRIGDLTEMPIVTIEDGRDDVTIRLGDPAVAPGTPQASNAYGEATVLRGSILTRTNASAVFTPSTPAVRPLSVPGYFEQRPPFTLRPREKMKVAVEVRPTAHGLRRASLRIRGVPASNPSQTITIQSQLQVEVVSGPLLQYAPNGLYIFRDANGSQSGQRTAVVFNSGHVDLTISQIRVTGSGSSRFVPTTNRGSLGPMILPPGDYVDVRVEYLPECDGTYGTATSALDHVATLQVTSDGGTASIPLGGASQGFCP